MQNCTRAWFLLSACLLAAPAYSAEPIAPPQRALLVGCTKYPECESIRPLFGPANDIPLFTSLLKEKFGFQDSEITTLFAWPEEESRRPTRANIVKAFEDLIVSVEKDSQVVILISGHGAQVPVMEVNGKFDLSESDGLDEIFLPADVKPWDGQKVPNAVVDNEFEEWLEALTGKGANVWIIFDTCHSGTMTRGAELEEPVERSRAVRAEDLSIPLASMKRRSSSPIGEETLQRIEKKAETTGGRLVAFSAAQSFEEAPELPRPSDAPRKPAYYYGLFTYSLVKSINRQQSAISYRDLGQSILNIYSAERGTRGPTPVFEGDLNRPVLKLDDWGKTVDFPVTLKEGTYQIGGGELQGVTAGSILSIVTGVNGAGMQEAVHGYVLVKSSNPLDAVATACTIEGAAAAPLEKLPDNSRCQVVTQALGNMRVKIALEIHPELAALSSARIQAALDNLPEGQRKLFQIESSVEDADWVVQLVPPAVVSERYGTRATAPMAVLLPRDANSGLSEAETPKSMKRKLFVLHPLAEPFDNAAFDMLAEQLGLDLQKIFTWQNVWRVTDSMSGESAGGDLEVGLKVRRKGEEILNPAVLYPGEDVEVMIENHGTRDWWVSLVFVGSDVSISPWLSGSIKASSKFRPARGKVNATTTGTEAFVVFASPVTVTQLEPDFAFLEQAGLSDTESTRGSKGEAPSSPLGQLLDAARTGKSTRGMSMSSSDQPSILMRSWVTQFRDE